MAESDRFELRGERLSVLRELNGVTQGELAEQLDVTQGFLSHVEKGQRPLPEAVAVRAAQAYAVPVRFFEVSAGVAGMGQPTFRKKAKAGVRDERRVVALHSEAARLFRHVSLVSGLGAADLPAPHDFDDDPELCAEEVRRSVGLAQGDPVPNMTRLLERRRVGVITRLDDRDPDVSDHLGISRPHPVNDRPLVAVTHAVPGAVLRLSLGHELGHLIFDQRLDAPVMSTRGPEEARAFRFAGSLLLPARIVRNRVTETLTLHGYLRIKADFGISVPAIVRRARDLNVISEARYRSLSIQISSQGWRANEPVDVADEHPTLVDQAVRKVFGSHHIQRASDTTGIPPAYLRRWLDETDDDEQREADRNVVPLPFPQ